MHTSLRDFFSPIPIPNNLWKEESEKQPVGQGLQKALVDLTAEEKKQLLLTPLSATTPENALSYIIADGFIDGAYSGDNEWRAAFLKVALDEIENLTQNHNERVALLTSANELGQTVFHKTLKYSGDEQIFDMLAERLVQWGGNDAADTFLKSFIEQPFGTIDEDVSSALQDVRNGEPWGSEQYMRIDNLGPLGGYQPAEYESLKATVDKIRPVILEWIGNNPADPKNTYQTNKNARLKAFAEDPNAVRADKTPLLQAFPGGMFWKFLDLQQKFAPKTPQQQADYIFEQLSKPDGDGNTAMNRRWQNSLLLGPPGGVGAVEDSLGPVIAGFDKRFGQDIALDLTKKLLLLEDKKGNLPLDKFQYNEAPERDYYIGGFLNSLREELGSPEKFKTYVTEVIAAFLPPDFTIKLGTYEPEPQPGEGPRKPRRGAKIEP